MKKSFAILDFGKSQMSLVAASWRPNGEYVIDGFLRTSSRGITDSIVSDEEAATDSIKNALEELQRKTGKKFHDVYVGVSSPSISIKNSEGSVLLSKYGREVSFSDIEKCVEIGSVVKIPLEKDILHRIVRNFSLDGEVVKNPLNLEAVKLGVSMNVVTINSSILSNFSKCLSQAGYIPSGFVFSGLASSERVLSEDDRRKGTALVNIRPNATEVMLFSKGTLANCKVFPHGHDYIAIRDGEITSERYDELISHIKSLPGWEEIRKIVMIGEGELSNSLLEYAEEGFNLPVASGVCIARPLEDLPPDRAGYITSLGMLDYLSEENKRRRIEKNPAKRFLNRVLHFLDRYF